MITATGSFGAETIDLLGQLEACVDRAAEAASERRLADICVGCMTDCLPIVHDAPAHDGLITAELQ